MGKEREKLVELVASQQVVNAELYNSVKQQTPLLSKLMLDKFKNFLNDKYFTDIERQTMLMTFFEEHTDIDLVQDILKYVEDCECKDDYTKIIMEWTYHNSEDIVKKNLAKVDGASLCDVKKKSNKLSIPNKATDTLLQGIFDLTINLLDNDDDEGIGG